MSAAIHDPLVEQTLQRIHQDGAVTTGRSR